MQALNELLYRMIAERSGQGVLLDNAAVFLAGPLLYFLILGAVLFIALEKGSRRRWLLFLEMSLAALLSRGLIAETFQYFYIHVRPYVFYKTEPLIVTLGNSFPSGHMTFVWALAGTIFLFDKRWGSVYFLLGALMGISRIYVGVHWPFDILGGMMFGLISALFVHRLLRTSVKAESPLAA